MVLRPYLETLTLLCVESSDVINYIYKDIFTILFKDIIFCKSANEALEIYNSNQISILLTAHTFEGMSGMDLIRNIREKNKEIPILFVSSFENVDLLTEALHLQVTSFVKKPFNTSDILDALENATRQLLAKKYIQEEQIKEMDSLQMKVEYSDYQENLSFKKALKLIKNDFYYKQLKQTNNSITIIDFLYTALDITSGDTYLARIIDKNKTLLCIIDGMGKGLSASISALLSVSFLNEQVDENIELKQDFSLHSLISKVIKNAQKNLLDEEILSLTLLLVNTDKMTLEYSSFSMPPILLEDKNHEIKVLKSNNPPLSPYTKNFKIQEITYKDVKKLLMYSDGLVENSLKYEKDTYSKYVEEDFKNSISREDLRKKIASRISKQEDDITFIFINYIPLKKPINSIIIDAKLDKLDSANEWFDQILLEKTQEKDIQSQAGLAFSELLMNAYEHGSLGLHANEKHALIEADEYFNFISKKELTCTKQIFIDVYEINNYILVKIKDEGKGFDTSTLSSILRTKKRFNQRGIFMSRNATQGIYYNSDANQITFIIKLNN